jgi:hypothetical protein
MKWQKGRRGDTLERLREEESISHVSYMRTQKILYTYYWSFPEVMNGGSSTIAHAFHLHIKKKKKKEKKRNRSA